MIKAESPDGGRKSSFDNPIRFVQEVLGDHPYDKQIEILKAVAESRRVSVVGCNGSGKDWAAARAVLWWVHSRYPAKAIVTGPTSRQVDDIVWNEIRYAYGKASDSLEGRMYRGEARYRIDDQTFALGFATDSPYNIQGFHSPNLLVVITEAHAVQQSYIDAVLRLNPTHLLLTGNPFAAAGEFFDSHHSKRELYKTVHISAFDTPNVKAQRTVVPGMITQQDIDERKQDWGEESHLYIGGVLGEFPDNLEDVMVPLRVADQAAKRTLEAEGPIIVACDVARYGQDKTVVMHRQGPVAHIVRRVRGSNTMETVGFLKAYCDEYHPDMLVVDDTGVGGGVVDRLRELRMGNTRLVPFISGGRANSSNYFVNRITEVWWTMRDRYLQGELDTDDDAALISQVSSRKYEWNSEGKIRLEAKERMPTSPDEADALAMTFAAESGATRMRIWV